MNQRFCNIMVVHASLWCVYHVTEAVQIVLGTCCGCRDIVVVDRLAYRALLHSVYGWKAEQMNVHYSLIWKFMF